MGRTVVRGRVARKWRSLEELPACELPVLFCNWTSLDEVQVEDDPAPERSIFTAVRTFWLFISQVLSADGACREAVAQVLSFIAETKQDLVSHSTSGYCQARKRLAIEWIQSIAHKVAHELDHRQDNEPTWCGRHVDVVDGSTLSMPDTKANQECWPQPSRQNAGCGFPVLRLVGLFSLATGALVELTTGSLLDSERELWRRLWSKLKLGHVVLSDRGFGSFAEFYVLPQRGVDMVCRLKAHKRTVREAKCLGKGDRLVEWTKDGKCRPEWMTLQQWDEMPEILIVRELEFHVAIPGFRTSSFTIATTLLDPVQFPKEQFAELYRRRWMAELFLRDLKIGMHMDVLRTKSPEMIEKEIAVYWIAYNLVRGLMLDASRAYPRVPRRISFKGTMVLLNTFSRSIARAPDLFGQKNLLECLLYYVAHDTLPSRPHRHEPRARKRRPKNYQLLNKPRAEFKEIKHRNRYTSEVAKRSA
jgi:hypothetical protein